jgi:hypothetical protein
MKKDRPSTRAFVTRKFRRVPLKVAFKISGIDQSGNQFEELVETQEVGPNGGSFPCKHEIKAGSTLKLAGPKGFVSLVRVVWVKENKNLRRKVGFQLLEPREDWVIQAQHGSSPLDPSKEDAGDS